MQIFFFATLERTVTETLISPTRSRLVPIETVRMSDYAAWRKGQPLHIRRWVDSAGFNGESGQRSLMAGADGRLERVFLGLGDIDAGSGAMVDDAVLWAFAGCAEGLPAGNYRIEPGKGDADSDSADRRRLAHDAALGWALGSYRFERYRKAQRTLPHLVWPEDADRAEVESAAQATFLVRDLVNTPAGDMGPSALADESRRLGRLFGARVAVTTGDALLRKNFPAIHAVGRAASEAPRLIDLRWKAPGAGRRPLVTICGKGVCFDTGGLDMKPSSAMKLMKKDMAGAAQALGLARMIMAAKLPLRLRVLIPAVENAVAGNAYHPLDVVPTRAGITVEVGNTDAEGRIVLADALAEACREKPELVIDFATLTGAARVALGTGLPALFCNDDRLAEDIAAAGLAAADPVWRLPLWRPYRPMIDSKVADICNISEGPFGGAITAALFLQEFVRPAVPWVHLDFMGWNSNSRPGRPVGGEAQGMRALFRLLAARYGD